MALNFRTLQYALISACILPVAACATTEPQVMDQAAIQSELMAADQAYEAYNLEYGYKAASLEFIDFENAFMIEAGDGFLTGKTDIMAERQLDTVPSPVHWTPIGAKASETGDFGITWGTFLVDYETDTTGNYVTVWKKVNGAWKIVTDVAVDDPVEE
jgi:hypothetical protein